MIEYVPSVSLARVLAEHRTITRFLHIHHPDASGTALLQGLCPCAICWCANVRAAQRSHIVADTTSQLGVSTLSGRWSPAGGAFCRAQWAASGGAGHFCA
jgi:hypothetical protein